MEVRSPVSQSDPIGAADLKLPPGGGLPGAAAMSVTSTPMEYVPHGSFVGLDQDTLNKVLKLSDAEALARLSPTCTSFRDAAADPELWQSLCRRRWRHLNIKGFRQNPSGRQNDRPRVTLKKSGRPAQAGRPAAAGHSGSQREAVPMASPDSRGYRVNGRHAHQVQGNAGQGQKRSLGHAYAAGRVQGLQAGVGHTMLDDGACTGPHIGENLHGQGPGGEGTEGQGAQGIGGDTFQAEARPAQEKKGQKVEKGEKVHALQQAGAVTTGHGGGAEAGYPPRVSTENEVAWRDLYSRNNGWALGFQFGELRPLRPEGPAGRWPPAIVSFALTTPAEAGWNLADVAPDDELLVTGQTGRADHSVDGLGMLYVMGNGVLGKPLRSRWALPPTEAVDFTALAVLPGNRVAFGGYDFNVGGRPLIYRIPYEDGQPTFLGAVKPQELCHNIDELLYCKGTETLFSLNTQDLEYNTICAHNLTQMQTTDIEELADGYELCCMCAGAEGDAWGGELYAGSVHGEVCEDCRDTGLPSMCFHKASVRCANIIQYDSRTPWDARNRFFLHHRSMYPHMCSARSTYLFTSHAGNPLCVWDKRQMSYPVFEEQRIGSFSPADLPGKYPLGDPTGFTKSQGMYLDTDGDVLIGRADNGMFWLWDLTKTLGWADGGGPNSWQKLADTWHVEAGKNFRDWPVPLGAWKHDQPNKQAVQIHSGRSCCLLGFGEVPAPKPYGQCHPQAPEEYFQRRPTGLLCASRGPRRPT